MPSGVSTLSGLSDFVRGGTTQVIKSSDDASGRGLSAEETSRLMDNIADETKYRELHDLDGEEGGRTRQSGEATEYTTWESLNLDGEDLQIEVLPEKVDFLKIVLNTVLLNKLFNISKIDFNFNFIISYISFT